VIFGESFVIPAVDTILAANEKSDIIADGVVIKVDNHQLRASLGVSSSTTNWQVCFKPQNAKGITYLRQVVWSNGRTGKLTPVGIVDPIVLAGATITRVNLNNITWIRNLGLKINSKIEIIRSGDVIPVVLGVIDEEKK
jgi:DNA ligase (NAD+)